MKQLPVILVVLMIILGVFFVFQISNGYVDAHKSAWQVEASAKAVMNVADYNDQLRNEAQRREFWTGFYQAVLTSLLVVGVAGAGVYYWKQYDQRRESWARAVDGTFALQQMSRAGQSFIVDPNKAVFGVFGQNASSGALITDANVVGPDRQLAYALNVQKTRTASAQPINEVRNSAQAKLAAGFYDRPQKNDEYRIIDESLPQITETSWKPLSLTDAFAKSGPDRWLLGQNNSGPCEFSIMDAQHVGILGATGCGKTASTALLMMLCALKSKFHVICLDGKGGMDWMRYKSHIEVYPTDYAMVGDQVNELYHAYTMRMKALSMAGASDISELDYEMKPVMVIMEEFGATMDLLKGESSKQHAAVEKMIKDIFRKGRSAGIHLVLIDQLMNGWPGVMKSNTKGIIAYKIGGQQGAAFNAYKLHELADKGQFWNNGGVYDAWFTKPEAERMLQKLQPSRTKLLTDVQYSLTHADTLAGREVNTEIPPLNNVSIGVSDEPYQSKSVSVGVSSDVSGDTSVSADVSPRLTGKPVSKKDIELVRNTYALTNSARETARILWGKRNDSRMAWIKEIVDGEVLQ